MARDAVTPRIAILGAGAIGCLFAARIAARGAADVTVITRDAATAAKCRTGIELWEMGNAQVVRVAATVGLLPAIAPDFLLATVKSYDLPTALSGLSPHLPAATTVVTLQNGLDAPSVAERLVGDGRVLAAVTHQAATRLGPAVVRHAGDGPTWVGSPHGGADARAERLAHTLTASGLSTQAVTDIGRVLWAKAAVNAAINPLGAILGWSNGRLADDAETVWLMQQAAAEVARVAAAEGFGLDGPAESAVAVARATKDNLCSMLQDLAARRPTELEAITGSVLRVAAQHKLEAPVNQVLYRLVRALTAAAGQEP